MCGVPSFDLAFTYYSLLKCKAFSITERTICALCQRNCPSALVHGQLRRLFFFSRLDVDEMSGVSSFAFTFTHEALAKFKAFSVTEREMFAFFQNSRH